MFDWYHLMMRAGFGLGYLKLDELSMGVREGSYGPTWVRLGLTGKIRRWLIPSIGCDLVCIAYR